ncbi:hypothetical protein TSUD_113560 [Trifolium subterraneum]|uniref:Lipoyl-binding domain-containing protein n=1 Tax=Trifolium subterraneum TaxID=3900 RepID=A0A2Z6LG34_TRISU|nr:hypothetical protein TSUD_113560 [Trifolium subterraneum]
MEFVLRPLNVINCTTGNLGTQNVKVLNLHFGQKRVWLSQQFGTRSWISRKSQKYTSLVTSQQTVRPLNLSDSQSSEILSFSRSEDASEEIKPSILTSQQIPNFKEVEFLLTNLCDTDSIGELELKLDGFHLRVVRDLTEKTKTLPPPIVAPLSINTTAEAPKPNGSASIPSGAVSIPTSLAISKPVPFSVSIQAFLDKAADEGLVIIQSPRVGFFRRSRTIKGKRARPSCQEMQIVKEGQVICYIEQLGGQLPIESDVSGEVIKILREDGDPVGYGDALIAVLPSFPGIKKLQ